MKYLYIHEITFRELQKAIDPEEIPVDHIFYGTEEELTECILPENLGEWVRFKQ